MKVYGPYKRKNDNYSHVIICYDDGSRRTMSYHKYLWENEYGAVEEGYDIHHIDENPDNNVLSNLEKVESTKHKREHASTGISMVEITCLECGSTVSKCKSDVEHNRSMGKAGPFCGKSCAGKWSARKQYGGVDQLA